MGNTKEIDEIETLERFLLENPELERLEGLLSQFNIFETLNIIQVEVGTTGSGLHF